MRTEYLAVKFLHTLIAIIALGASAGLGIVLELYGDHPVHGFFVLRAIRRIVALLVLPGYALMLATGLWMADRSWSLSLGWIRAALLLWGIGLALTATSLAVLHRQISLIERAGPTSAAYRRLSFLGRLLGGGAGLAVIGVLYFMIFKPA